MSLKKNPTHCATILNFIPSIENLRQTGYERVFFFFFFHTTVTLNEGEGQLRALNVKFDGLYHHTKFKRNRSVNVKTQASVVFVCFFVCFFLSLFTGLTALNSLSLD